jgi:hypothetical protein
VKLSSRFFCLAGFFACSLSFATDACNWTMQSIGELDRQVLAESSGLSHSLLLNNRLYHVNDSGSGAVFYLSNLQGQNLQAIHFDFDARDADIEDSDAGYCGEKSCLFLGDTGDNRRQRKTIRIILIEEQEVFSGLVKPRRILELRYPDGPHDAEALAVSPEGDIYILTKEAVSLSRPMLARLYRLDYQYWSTAHEVQVLRLVALLDLKALSGSSLDLFSHTATAMDFSPDGHKLLILTYGDAFELEFNADALDEPLALTLNAASSYQTIKLDRLPQQESLTYLDAHRFIYTTEAKTEHSPVVEASCLRKP